MTERLVIMAVIGICLAVAGCQNPSTDMKSTPSSTTTQPEAPAQGHIEMPVQDIAVEMQQHCTAATTGFQRVKDKIDAALAHGNADEIHYKLKRLSPELNAIKADLEKGSKMAHGIYEKSLGKEPPK